MSARRLKGLLPVLGPVFAMLGGCAAGEPEVTALHASAQCPLSPQRGASGVQLLNDAGQWADAFGPQAPDTLLGRPVDWVRERIVVFTLGQRPNLGHGVDLTTRMLGIKGDVLELPVTVRKPPPDAMVAMAIAYPCVIAAVPAAGWSQVRVVDVDGKVLATSEAPR